MNTQRRGFCPGISAPLQTGDGLLARLAPSAAIPVHAFIALCEASERNGNGIVEVTQRGSIQLRGLTPSSALDFARSVASLGLGDENKPSLLQPPLLGIDATATVDLQPLVSELRLALSNLPYLDSLGPKVSVLVDGEGELHLDAIPADIRLRSTFADDLHVAIGGTAHDAVALGWIKTNQAIATVDELLAIIARAGRDARGKHLANGIDIERLQARLDRRVAPPSRPIAEPIGLHSLKSGKIALGISLAFGHATSASVLRIVHAAADLGVTHIQPAPGRALLFIELAATSTHEIAAIASNEGFIATADDPRRHVFACAGSPACNSAAFSTRDLAPAVAIAAREWLSPSTTIHLSGCSKGCAHPAAATLTLAGDGRLIIDGRASDESHATLPSSELIGGLARLGSALLRERTSLSQLGSARVIECLTNEIPHA
ncbi:MAG: precorrin-3B synthase [Steroidobacteraceae bacterium]